MADDNVILDSYFGDVNNSFYAGPNGADFHIRKVYGNLREMLEDTINDNTVLIGDYFLVNYGDQNNPSDGSKNPNGLSYNRNKSIDAVDGEVLDVQITTTSPSVQIKRKTDIPDGDIGDICFSTTSNTWWFIDSEYTGSSAQPQWVICNTFILDESIFTAPSGYYNATLWRRKETEITEEGIVNPFDYYELMFQSVAAMPEINVTTHTINAGSVPTASITGAVESRTIDFGLPTPWGFTATVTAASPSITPTAALEDISGNTTTKRVHFIIPKTWGITIGTVTAGNPGTTPTASMGTSGDNKQLNLTLPKTWDITATVTPTTGDASVSVTQSSTTKTFAFQLPVVPPTPNENLVYNPWFTVNSRGYEEYRGQDCSDILFDNDTKEEIEVTTVYNYSSSGSVSYISVYQNGSYIGFANVNGVFFTSGEVRTNKILCSNNRDISKQLHWVTNSDYTLDSWKLKEASQSAFFGKSLTTIVKQNGVNNGIILISKASGATTDDSSGIHCSIDNPDLFRGQTVTLSVVCKGTGESDNTKDLTYILDNRLNNHDGFNITKDSDGWFHLSTTFEIPSTIPSSGVDVYGRIDPFTSTSKHSTIKLLIDTQGYIYIVLEVRAQQTAYFKKVKLETGNISTLDYESQPNLIEEYNKCNRRISTTPSNYSDDYACGWIQSPINIFTSQSSKVSSCYEIGKTYLPHADEIYYGGEVGTPGAILNNKPIYLDDSDKYPMVCGTFVQLMLGGIPYDQSRIATGVSFDTIIENGTSHKRLLDGTNTSQPGMVCMDLNSPIIRQYWNRYKPQEQLYSATLGRLLYDAGLLNEITDDLTVLRPGDIIFFNSTRKKDMPTSEGGELNYRRWDAMQHVELFLGWSLVQSLNEGQLTDPTLYGWSLCVTASNLGNNIYLGYKSFPASTALTSQTSRLKWYARLTSWEGSDPQNLFSDQKYKESLDGQSLNLPATWSSLQSCSTLDPDKSWKIIPLDSGKTLEYDRSYTIIFEVSCDQTTLWHFQVCTSSGISNKPTVAARVDCNQSVFYIGTNSQTGAKIYTCNIHLNQPSTTTLVGFGVCPTTNSASTSSNSATLTSIKIYDKLVSY